MRKLANLKHRDLINVTLREGYHTVLKQYKSLLTRKKNEYYQTKISELESTVDNSDSRNFWNCLESMDDSVKETSIPPISEEHWMSHFQSLHSNEPLNLHQEAVISELRSLEDATTHSHSLDYLITELEIRTAAKKLKNNKSPFSDKIKNEIIKSSLKQLMPVYFKLFNRRFLARALLCLKHGAVALLHQSLKVGLKMIPQIIGEYVFLVVLVNYFVPFLIKDFLNTFSRLTYFINLKLVF